MHSHTTHNLTKYSRPGGSKFEVVRPGAGLCMDLFSAGEIVMAYVSTPKVGESEGMLPQENFEIYNL